MYPWIRIPALFLLLLPLLLLPASEAACSAGCGLALASYYIVRGQTLGEIGGLFNIAFDDLQSTIPPYNPVITDINLIEADSRVNIPFPSCDCIDGNYHGHAFRYTVQQNNTYTSIATDRYHNLTTADRLARTNTAAPATSLQPGQNISVIVNCSCGDSAISSDYGLFLTYALRAGDTLRSVAREVGFNDTDLIQRYNPGVDFSAGRGLVFLPIKDSSGSYRPLKSSAGISRGAIAGIIVAAVILLALVVGLCVLLNKRKRAKKSQFLKSLYEDQSISYRLGAPESPKNNLIPTKVAGGVSAFSGITVDKSVEFSYEELANATDDFNMKNKIGEGGFGAVYYAELRGEKTAIKRMATKDSKEFLSELKVLTHVHHLNLVRLIGYCTESSLFLVYEYMENGNLSQHLRGSERAVLPWPVRVQIALDSARGLEYIHEHTVPVYIHRDIKSPNILLDKNFHAKVADFGLAKLTAVDSTSGTRLVGTFGYMPPEYAQFGDVSPKIDVYAFGVVLYELISAKEAVVRTDATYTESKGLVALFEGALSQADSTEELQKLVDQRLGHTYPIDAVQKMAQLAKACTQEDPQLRPSMRSVVVALMTLSSSTEDWDGASFLDNQALANLMSGR